MYSSMLFVNLARSEDLGIAFMPPYRAFSPELVCAYILPGIREKSVGVPVAVNVKAYKLAFVVETIDSGRPDAIAVVDRQESPSHRRYFQFVF